MPDARHELAMAALRSRIAGLVSGQAIPGTSTLANYTPNQVVRVDELDVANLRTQDNSGDAVVVQILEGDEFPTEGVGGEMVCEAEVFILAAKLWKPNSTNPYATTPPLPATLRTRMAQDIGNLLEADITLGASPGVLNTEVRAEDRGIRIESTALWVAIELRVVITYEHIGGQR